MAPMLQRRALPVIDLTASLQPDAGARALTADLTAARIDQACRQHGFFYISGHGIAQARIDDAYAASRAFFALPEDTKDRWHIRHSGIKRGFDPVGWQSLDPGRPHDLKESFYLGVDRPPHDPLVLAGTPNHGPNQWPDEPLVPGFRYAMEAYAAALDGLSRHLMGLLAIGLGLDARYFDTCLRDPMPVLRLLHYPPQPPALPDGQLGCGAHTDWGGITLLAQDAAGGLQVQADDGEWIDAPPIPGTLVVNLGDMMARWTNDRYRSTLHRVTQPQAARERYSMAWFFDVDYHTVVEPLAVCVNHAHPPRYDRTTAGEHLIEMYRRTTTPVLAPAAARETTIASASA